MLALYARNPASSFGLTGMLDLERIPYRVIERIDPTNDALVIVAADDLSDAELDTLRERPSIILHGGGVAARLLGAVRAQSMVQPCGIALDAAVWPATVCAQARLHNLTHLQIPSAQVCLATPPSQGHVLATLNDGSYPVVVRHGGMIWCAIDLGAAFTTLCSESYLPDTHRHGPSSRLAQWLRQGVEDLCYAAPDRLRHAVQAYSYRQLEPRLQALGGAASTYPIDPTGWLLVELLKQLIRLSTGRLVRLARWPAPYTAAGTLTHDIEPRRYAYTTGLDRLLHATAATPTVSTFGLIAQACERHLPKTNALCLEQRNVICHGLSHRGEAVSGRLAVAGQLAQARHRLERHLQRPVCGYRSPRLDRSPDLQWALDHEGFAYDSSYPDIDRENMRHFGGGVRLNVPFRPPLVTADEPLRPSRCLELPLTAPDCVQPLFAGASEGELNATITAKAAFLRDTGGLYVALIHAGVFGDRDAQRRENLLRHVHSQLQRPDVWLAGIPEIVDWWTARERVELSLVADTLLVRNLGEQFVSGLRVVVDIGEQEHVLDVPNLPPGREISLALPTDLANDTHGTDRQSSAFLH